MADTDLYVAIITALAVAVVLVALMRQATMRRNRALSTRCRLLEERVGHHRRRANGLRAELDAVSVGKPTVPVVPVVVPADERVPLTGPAAWSLLDDVLDTIAQLPGAVDLREGR